MTSNFIQGDQVRAPNDGKVYSVLGTAKDLLNLNVDLMVICETADPGAKMILRDEKWLDWCVLVEGNGR